MESLYGLRAPQEQQFASVNKLDVISLAVSEQVS